MALNRSLVLIAGLLAASTALPAQHEGVIPKPLAKVEFVRDVRPILAQRCFSCHGPDEAARKGKLRLDLRTEAFAERKAGAPFVAGDVSASLVMDLVTTEDQKRRMPPVSQGDALSPAEIATLKTWIEDGAQWTEHWSFAAPSRPAVPKFEQLTLREPIDAFLRVRLSKEGLKPSLPASRERWLRRASLDITGIAPTPEELDAFISDKRDDAFELVADRLLASPRYGEHAAAEWMDVARYADTGGYQADAPREMWKWREWVLNALNTNMPYDRFATEQLAGDLLENPTLDQRVATGFNRNHPTNSEAGEEEDEYRSAYVIDRVNTTSTAFLGLTLACAQCHDHKYDPLSQKDYYRFFAFFNQVKERDSGFSGGKNPKPSISVPNADQSPLLVDVTSRLETLEKRLESSDPTLDALEKTWREQTKKRLEGAITWIVPEPVGLLSKNGSTLTRQDDGSILASGPAPVRDTYEIVLRPGRRRLTGLKIEALPDPSQPHGASGRADDGRFQISSLRVHVQSLLDSEDAPALVMAAAEPDLRQKSPEDPGPYEIFPGAIESSLGLPTVEIPGSIQSFRGGGGWCLGGVEGRKPHEAILLPRDIVELNDASVIRITIEHEGGVRKFKSLLGRFRFSLTEDLKVRELYLPAVGKPWQSVGPFPAESVEKAFTTAFAPETEIRTGFDFTKVHDKPELPEKKPEAKASDAKKPGSESKAKEEKPAEAKAEETKPVEAKTEDKKDRGEKKPEAEKKEKDAKASEADAGDGKKDAKADEKKPAPPKKKEKVAWTEQKEWRDGQSGKLSGANAAFYLVRTIESSRPRVAEIEIRGPLGLRAWMNGEAVTAIGPPPPVAEPPAEKPSKPKAAEENAEAGDDDSPEKMEEKEPEEKDIIDPEVAMALSRAKSKEPFHIRVGLRAGENTLVLKVVYGGASAGDAKRPSENPVAAFMEGKFGSQRGSASGGFSFRLISEGSDLLTHEVATALLAKEPTPELEKKIRVHYRTHLTAEGRAIADEMAKLKKEKDQLKSRLPEAMVMEELKEPRKTHVYIRGQYKNKGEEVEANTPSILPAMAPDLPKNRLGLSKWLTAKDHPLFARVHVNRVWQRLFGVGLVKTSDDFGLRSAIPTHPELLDYLAVEFVASGFDMKKLVRRIVLSDAYRQSAVITPALLEKDPENLLLARGPRQRLSAEMIRDQAMASSGLLFERLGGPSVRPWQPSGVGDSAGFDRWQRTRGLEQYRRGLYVYWRRGTPYPSMSIFDAAKRETCTVVRPLTTTPLQALVLLNDPVHVEAAKILGQRLLKEGGRDDAARLRFGYRLVTSREPDAEDLAQLTKLLEAQRAHFKANTEAAKKLLAVGDAKVETRHDPVELAALASVASVLLNLDAALNRG